MFVTGSYKKKTEEHKQWAREEKEWTMRHKDEKEGTKLRERRGRDGNEKSCAWRCWEKLAHGEGWWQIAIAAAAVMAMARAAA